MYQFKEKFLKFSSLILKIGLSFFALLFFIGSLSLISDTPEHPRDPVGAIVFFIVSLTFIYLLFRSKISKITGNIKKKNTFTNNREQPKEEIGFKEKTNRDDTFRSSFKPINYNDLSFLQKNQFNDIEDNSPSNNCSIINHDNQYIKISSDLISIEPLLSEAIYFILEEQKASTSLIQRKFKIGYNRAANIIDMLETIYIIGPANGSTPRDVYYRDNSVIKFIDSEPYTVSDEFSNINTDFNSYLEKIALDKNILDNDESLDRVLKYVTSSDFFNLNSFQTDMNFDFLKTSSYIDTLRALEIIDDKNELVNKYSFEEIQELINNAIKLNPTLISERKLDSLVDGYEFEKFIANILNHLGYTASVTAASNDYGVDVIATKENITYAIQCKYYSSTVGNSAVQEIVSGMFHYNAHLGVVVTNNYFTRQAKELAISNKVLLWDRDDVLKMINSADK